MNAARPKSRKKRIQKPPGGERPIGASREGEAFRRAAINVFLLFHLVAITCVAVPSNFSFVRGVKELVAPYLRWTGLYQTWDMFAPDPVKVNAYLKSVVMTQQRHVHVWSLPRMEELGYAERYRKERYRKFAEILPLPQNAPLWPDVARHLAGMFPSKTDPPEKVILIQFVTDIVPGTNESRETVARPYVFYDDYLPPGNLR